MVEERSFQDTDFSLKVNEPTGEVLGLERVDGKKRHTALSKLHDVCSFLEMKQETLNQVFLHSEITTPIGRHRVSEILARLKPVLESLPAYIEADFSSKLRRPKEQAMLREIKLDISILIERINRAALKIEYEESKAKMGKSEVVDEKGADEKGVPRESGRRTMSSLLPKGVRRFARNAGIAFILAAANNQTAAESSADIANSPFPVAEHSATSQELKTLINDISGISGFLDHLKTVLESVELPSDQQQVEPTPTLGVDDETYRANDLYRDINTLTPAEIRDTWTYDAKYFGWTNLIAIDGEERMQVYRPHNGDHPSSDSIEGKKNVVQEVFSHEGFEIIFEMNSLSDANQFDTVSFNSDSLISKDEFAAHYITQIKEVAPFLTDLGIDTLIFQLRVGSTIPNDFVAYPLKTRTKVNDGMAHFFELVQNPETGKRAAIMVVNMGESQFDRGDESYMYLEAAVLSQPIYLAYLENQGFEEGYDYFNADQLNEANMEINQILLDMYHMTGTATDIQSPFSAITKK